MSRIFTPSERTRRNTNPQPVNTNSSGIRRSRYLVLLKNIVGAPIPFLWVILAISLFTGYDFHKWLALAIACFTAFYIVLDRFSHSREFRFFHLGIEIPLGLLFVFLGLTNLQSGSDFFSRSVYDLASWSILLYLLTYSLNLFPGLNRFFLSFSITGFGYICISIWQYFTGTSLLWGSQAPSFISPLQTGLSMLSGPHSFVSGCLVLYALSFFVYKKRKFSPLGAIFAILLLLSSLSLLIGQKIVFLSAFAIPSFYYCIFVSKKLFRDLLLSAMGFFILFTAAQNLDFTKSLLNSEKEIENIKIEKEYWREKFETYGDNIWLGKEQFVEKIDFLGAGVNEAQIFHFESNYYLNMLTEQGIIHLALIILIFLVVLFKTMNLLGDIPDTHHWHKVFAFSLICTHIFLFISFMDMIPWYSGQITSLMLCFFAISFYMADAYTKQIVPDDQSL